MDRIVLLCVHLLLVMFCIHPLFADWQDRKAEGWAWYEDRKEEQCQEKEREQSLTESAQIQEIRRELKEKLSKALLNPTNENVLAYMQEQKKMGR